MSTNPDEDIVYLEKPDTAFLTKARITEWEAGKTFSTDWAAAHFFAWAELLHPLPDKPLRILEIGSWEGRSALFFLNYLPRSRITCIDPFGGNVEHHINPYFAALAPSRKPNSTPTSRRSRSGSRSSRAARRRCCRSSALAGAASISPISTAATWPPTSIATPP